MQYFIITWPDQSMKSIIDSNRWQSIAINRLISEIVDQSMAKEFVFFNYQRFSSIAKTKMLLQKKYGEL